ncbi:MAG TPA: hypothetical protein VGS19_32210 [Streptosporangiaceae bacterium]|nr:hypothetical protein [Streptosporangiaceae bacterium]
MTVRQRWAVLVAAAALCSGYLTSVSAMAPAASAANLKDPWGTAAEVPGTNALNAGGRADITSVSCKSAGNCSAGGFYASGTAGGKPVKQALVVTESGGRWGTAAEVPGSAALNAGGTAQIDSISCSAPGDCSAGGYYSDAAGNAQAFVVNQAGGTWGTAEEVPGTAALDHSPGAEVLSVSCGAAGNCSAGGFYSDAAGHQQAFVATETGGTWHTAQEVPGTATLNAGGYAAINSVSCAAAGACGAGGYYASTSVAGIPTVQALVVTETGGTWHTAQEVPGTAALNAGGYAAVSSVSCSAAAYCSAGGEYTNSTPATEAFVVSLHGGTWKTAHEVGGIGALNSTGLAVVNSVSCVSPGNCSAAGAYEDANFDSQAFAVGQSGGTWGTAQEVPGTAALDQGSPGASAVSVSCGAVGDCSLGGYYSDASGQEQAFVASEASGTWGTAEEVPGTAALNAGGAAGTDAVSCPSAGNCSTGGHYTTSQALQQAFVAEETGGP